MLNTAIQIIYSNITIMIMGLDQTYHAHQFIFSFSIHPTKEEVNAFARVCLFVCLSVSKITQKRVHGFG